MATGDDDNEVDGDGATGNEVNNDGNGAMGDDNDDDDDDDDADYGNEDDDGDDDDGNDDDDDDDDGDDDGGGRRRQQVDGDGTQRSFRGGKIKVSSSRTIAKATSMATATTTTTTTMTMTATTMATTMAADNDDKDIDGGGVRFGGVRLRCRRRGSHKGRKEYRLHIKKSDYI